jgi:hypothetical protein
MSLKYYYKFNFKYNIIEYNKYKYKIKSLLNKLIINSSINLKIYSYYFNCFKYYYKYLIINN